MLGLEMTLRAIENNDVVGILSSKLRRNLFQFFSMSHRSQDSCQLPWKKKSRSKEVKTSTYSCKLLGKMWWEQEEISSVTHVLGPHSRAAAVRWCSQVDVNCSQCYKGKIPNMQSPPAVLI